MQDAGIAILESFDSEVYNNTFENVKYGVRISLGGGNNSVHDNVFRNCSKCKRIVSNHFSVSRRRHWMRRYAASSFGISLMVGSQLLSR